jgi:hypothetical protein
MADLDAARKKKGFAKIEQCCRQALGDGFDWAWVDTCCIDKTSSAELSETINSMFKWYERALKCYAFLSDVAARPGELFAGQELDGAPRPLSLRRSKESVLFASRWWTRGWTLQELIAPRDVEFYNRDWEYLTCKRAFKDHISIAFGIAVSVLDHSRRLAASCVAERISWASQRTTTRDEDMAYSLLGILDVSMPLLYGEGGPKAFQRLQGHVMASTEDYTLFLWGSKMTDLALLRSWDLALLEQPRAYRTQDAGAVPSFLRAPVENTLANSPRDFRLEKAWSDWSHVDPTWLGLGEPPQLTSRGLRLSLFVRQVTRQDMDEGSELYDLLNDFFVCLSADKDDGNFGRWLRPRPGDLAHPLFLGAFPCSNTAPTPLLPCILLFNLDSFNAPLGDTTSLLALGPGFPVTYARLKYFFYKLPSTRLRSPKWELEACYLKSRPDSQLYPPQHGASRPSHSEFWIWRTPDPNIVRFIVGNKNDMETRRSLHMDATDTFPGCEIFVAIRPGHYWFSHRVGTLNRIINPYAHLMVRGTYEHPWSRHTAGLRNTEEGEQFRAMDLSSMWVETMRETGPLCEAQVDFGTKSLLITLCVEKSDGLLGVCYKVYLAIGEKRDRPQGEAPAVLQLLRPAEGGRNNPSKDGPTTR